MKIRLSGNPHQFMGHLFGDWSTYGAGEWKTGPFVPPGPKKFIFGFMLKIKPDDPFQEKAGRS
jgi:hypothetical protein